MRFISSDRIIKYSTIELKKVLKELEEYLTKLRKTSLRSMKMNKEIKNIKNEIHKRANENRLSRELAT